MNAVGKVDLSKLQWAYLPPICIDNIMSNWLDSRDLLSLDTALTNKKLRKLLISIFEDIECVAFTNFTIKSTQTLRWLMVRSIDISNFYLSIKDAPRTMPSFQWLVSKSLFIEAEYVGSRVLKSLNVDVNAVCEYPALAEYKNCPLHVLQFAACMGLTSLVQMLCRLPDIRVNSVSLDCDSALHEAVRRRHLGIVQILCNDARVNVNQPGRNGSTPLFEAVLIKDESLVKLLLKAGAVSDGRAPDQSSILHIATANQQAGIVRLLLACAANPDLQANDGRTPLHLALQINAFDIARMLMVHGGAATDIRDILGQSASDINPSYVKVCQAELLDLGGPDRLMPEWLQPQPAAVVDTSDTRKTSSSNDAAIGVLTERRVRKPSMKVMGVEMESAAKRVHNAVKTNPNTHQEPEGQSSGSHLSLSEQGSSVIMSESQISSTSQSHFYAEAETNAPVTVRARGRPKGSKLDSQVPRHALFEGLAQPPVVTVSHPYSDLRIPPGHVLPPAMAVPTGMAPATVAITAEPAQPVSRTYDIHAPAEGVHGLHGMWPDWGYLPKTFVKFRKCYETPVLFSYFVHLPESVLRRIVGNFLNVDETARLDSALTNHARRQWFLSSLQGLVSPVYNNFKYYRIDALKWVLSKGVLVNDFRLFLSYYKSTAKQNSRLLQYLLVVGDIFLARAVLLYSRERAFLDVDCTVRYFLEGTWVRLTPLMYAARMGHSEVVRMLVQEAHVNVNLFEPGIGNAILLAARGGHASCIAALVHAGKCNLHAVDQSHDTALHWACRENHVEAALTLLEAGANASAQNLRGNTPLHTASEIGNLTLVRALVRHGADVEIRSKRGRTALHWACEKHHLDVARFLIVECGANAHLPDSRGYMPLHYGPLLGFIAKAGGVLDLNNLYSESIAAITDSKQNHLQENIEQLPFIIPKLKKVIGLDEKANAALEMSHWIAITGSTWQPKPEQIVAAHGNSETKVFGQAEVAPASSAELLERHLNWAAIAESFKQRFMTKISTGKTTVQLDFAPNLSGIAQPLISWWTMLLMDALICCAADIRPTHDHSDLNAFDQHTELALAVSWAIDMDEQSMPLRPQNINKHFTVVNVTAPWYHYKAFESEFLTTNGDQTVRHMLLQMLTRIKLDLNENLISVLMQAANRIYALTSNPVMPAADKSVEIDGSAVNVQNLQPQHAGVSEDVIPSSAFKQPVQGSWMDRRRMLGLMQREQADHMRQEQVIQQELQSQRELEAKVKLKQRNCPSRSMLFHPLFQNVLFAAQGIPLDMRSARMKSGEMNVVLPPVLKTFINSPRDGCPGAPMLGMSSGTPPPIGSQGLGASVPNVLGAPLAMGLQQPLLTAFVKENSSGSAFEAVHPLTGDVGLAAPYMSPLPANATSLNTYSWHPWQGYSPIPRLPDWRPRERVPGSPFSLWLLLSARIQQRIVALFLDVRDVGRLDQAVGSVSRRKELAAVCMGMRSPSFDQFPYKSIESLRWVMYRSIDIRNFSLNITELPAGMTSLHKVCAESIMDILAMQIVRGKGVHINLPAHYPTKNSVDAPVKYALTPLQYAFFTGNMRVLYFLVLVGHAQLDTLDPYGNTLLHYVSESGNIELVRLFLVHGKASATVRGSKGYTALHWAARMGQVEIARMLVVEGKALVNAQNDAGYTPLHLAVKESHFAMCHLLLAEYGANVSARDAKGRTPLDLAVDRRLSIDLVQMLEEANARLIRSQVKARIS